MIRDGLVYATFPATVSTGWKSCKRQIRLLEKKEFASAS